MKEQDMNKILSKAEVLIEALPYIQKFNRKYIVVKYGGSAMSNEADFILVELTQILYFLLFREKFLIKCLHNIPLNAFVSLAV